MWFTLTLEARDGSRCDIRYNPHTSEIDGIDLGPLDERDWLTAPHVSKLTPVGKSHAPKVLKIQLGLSCNYSCSYCSQAHQIGDATLSKLTDVEAFLTNLDSWLKGAPERIELWGGEPFVYWAKLKRLIPALAERFPTARFLIITNGSLLDREKLDLIVKYDIDIGLSHDGPGQRQRGPDPLDDPERRHWIEALLAEREDHVSINTVLTAENHDLDAIKVWFQERLGLDVPISLEGVVNVYDAATLLGAGRLEEADLHSLRRSLFESLATDPKAFGLDKRLRDFIMSLKVRRPIEALGQKCGMDRPEHIAVDLRGNVMTCQNTGAKGEHKIGHVDDFDAIALNTATHFAFRDECMSCPVVQLCKGSCMFLEGEFFKQSCANEFAFNMGIMMAAVWHLTGMVVVGVEGCG
ncbi:radical SAM/SPASM domain-containing protein [Lentibacter algarum]|uniref:radical SAM/SPASM domain-containing protein n=1 Tax=Lentibacter algarum TaxID=576131 RepID=UPI0024900B01|nr:radical SAM protein [Lentibacter algarum]